MRRIVEPRVIPSDGHLIGLLGLARVIVRWLDLRAKETVGFRGLEGLESPRMRWSRGSGSALLEREGEEEGEGKGQGNTAAGGLLHHVLSRALFHETQPGQPRPSRAP